MFGSLFKKLHGYLFALLKTRFYASDQIYQTLFLQDYQPPIIKAVQRNTSYEITSATLTNHENGTRQVDS